MGYGSSGGGWQARAAAHRDETSLLHGFLRSCRMFSGVVNRTGPWMKTRRNQAMPEGG